jgi:DNA-binding NarL/FixJ family response regulator
MHRVFLACDDAVFCHALSHTFQIQADFIVCGQSKNDIEVLKEVMKLAPSLVVIEVELPPRDSLEIAEALKIIMPKTPLFLVTEQDVLQQIEKEALSSGIDAVFAKDDDVTSLVDNARAVLAPS